MTTGDIPATSPSLLDEQTEENVKKLLEGEIDLRQYYGLHELSGGTLKEESETILNQVRLLHILNITYKATGKGNVIDRARNHLDDEESILHIRAEDPTCTYVDAVEGKGRLLLPSEYENMMRTYDGLEPLFDKAVEEGDRQTVASVVEKVKAMIPHKALVLARMHGYSYEKVLEEFKETSGSVELVSPEDFADIVAMRVDELEVKEECCLQLSKELEPLDSLLSMGEWQRTPENRTALVEKIIETAPDFSFVLGNQLHSKPFYETYTDKFDIGEMARPAVKWKCMGECLACHNWRKSLVRPDPSYGHM